MSTSWRAINRSSTGTTNRDSGSGTNKNGIPPRSNNTIPAEKKLDIMFNQMLVSLSTFVTYGKYIYNNNSI